MSCMLTVYVLIVLLGFACVASPHSQSTIQPKFKNFLLVVTTDGKLYALTDEGGTLLWQSSLGMNLLSTRHKLGSLEEVESLIPQDPAILPFLDGRAVMYSPSRGFLVF